ncbi:MAG: hypothetical protein IIC84_05820 [Chloroflexi bacterium]|nr:hypothetical protein [Chloroflexota bacterium]
MVEAMWDNVPHYLRAVRMKQAQVTLESGAQTMQACLRMRWAFAIFIKVGDAVRRRLVGL